MMKMRAIRVLYKWRSEFQSTFAGAGPSRRSPENSKFAKEMTFHGKLNESNKS
jgi:hypothetical protein